MNSDPIDFKTFEEYEKFCSIKVYLVAFAITFFFILFFIASRNYVPLILVTIISAGLIYFETNICRFTYDNAWNELKSYGNDESKARELYFRNKAARSQTHMSFNNRGNTGNNFSISF